MHYQRVLVGFDGSPASERALALALRLRARDGELVAMTVAETHFAMHAGMDAVSWDEQIRTSARDACEKAERELAGVRGARVELTAGHPAKALVNAAAAMDADLIAVGADGHSRIAGILLGSVAMSVVHDAPCSVLVARGESDCDAFPSSVTVAEAGSGARELIQASRSCDLLVVGGAPERVAHDAACSVLVLRGETARPTAAPFLSTAGR
jgi:nucleotide-binding universal stress UspA family protein